MRAPAKVISSWVTASAATSPGAPPASDTRRATSKATKQPSRLSIERETTRPFGYSTGSPAITATSPMRTRARASSPSLAPMSMCRCLSSGAFVRSSSLSRWIGFLPTTPGTMPVARGQLHALADEDHRVPAADAAEPEEAVVVDVVDDEADLVDVADDGEQRAAGRPLHARDAGADAVVGHLGERGGGVAEHGGGRLLVARRTRSGEQVSEDVWHGHGSAHSSDTPDSPPSRPRHVGHPSRPRQRAAALDARLTQEAGALPRSEHTIRGTQGSRGVSRNMEDHRNRTGRMARWLAVLALVIGAFPGAASAACPDLPTSMVFARGATPVTTSSPRAATSRARARRGPAAA